MSDKSDNVRHLPSLGDNPKGLIHNVQQEVDDLDDVLVIGRKKDGGVSVWSTRSEAYYFGACQAIIQDLTLASFNGDIVDE